jgi:Uma2 family endonuclease
MSSLGIDARTELPPVDEHIVVPECGYEIDDGEVVLVPPSHEPHATCHSKLQWLLEAHKAAEFDVACDMLTRISETSDRAPDASVYPRARDPRTGGRQLEHLAFEVVSTESLGDAARKAAGLVGRGVRRVFAVDVKRRRVLEWAPGRERWTELDGAATISDPALVTPLPVQALLRDAEADYAVGRALVIKRNPAIEEARQESKAKGRAEAIIEVLASRGLVLSAHEQEQILGERDPARLGRWLARVATCESTAELLAIR